MRRSSRPALAVAAAVAVASALLLSGCTQDSLAEQYREGSGKNYIAGDGTISEYKPAAREKAVAFSGTTVDGSTFDSARHEGDVTVVNFWYAGCAPCRVEAPLLEKVAVQYKDRGVTFVGVNVRDQAGTAASFEHDYGLTYPSILDVDQGAVQLAFAGKVPPAAVPTTLVLDKRGRVAARVLGQLQDASILSSLIDTLRAEGS